jgi:NADH dehydrogenase
MTKPRILILGGGFGGLFTALELAGSGDVTLVTDADHFLFTPMLYEYLSGEVEAWHIAPSYDELLDDSVQCIQDAVTGVDLTAQTVSLAKRGEALSYDMLVLALGGVTNYAGVEGAEEFSTIS